MSLNFEIRTAKPDDLPELAGLLKVLFSIEKDFIFDSEKQTAGLRLLLDHPDHSIILTATLESAIIGMATGQLVVSTACGGYSLLIEDVVVADGFRNRGVGKKLLETLEDWGKTKGVKRMQLVADKNNLSATRFYSKNEWQESDMIGFYKLLSIDDLLNR